MLPVPVSAPDALTFRPSLEMTHISEPRNENYYTITSTSTWQLCSQNMCVEIFVARFWKTCFSVGGAGELLPVPVSAPEALAFRPSLEITEIRYLALLECAPRSACSARHVQIWIPDFGFQGLFRNKGSGLIRVPDFGVCSEMQGAGFDDLGEGFEGL